MRQSSLLAALSLCLAACGPRTAAVDEINTKLLTLPSGQQVRAEIMMRDEDMMRGMMFRDVLPPGRGMLFVHGRPGNYSYWMYQVRLPLDIVWMDNEHRVVDISANTPPCPHKSAKLCPQFGGTKVARFVLELAGGQAASNGVQVGTTIQF